MLGMLVEAFRGDRIAADRSLTRKRNISLENLAGITADFSAGAAAVEGLMCCEARCCGRGGRWPL
jgi:hypothetical protein